MFVLLMTFPIWKNALSAQKLPNPEKPKGVKDCVKPVEYMRTTHMLLLDRWRDEVLREGNRTPIPVDGIDYPRSLMNGCMKCHTSKKKFCDECHVYTSVKPYCWDCHFVPGETL